QRALLRDKQRREGHAGYEPQYLGAVAKQHLECDSQHVLRLEGTRIRTCDCSVLFRRVRPLTTGQTHLVPDLRQRNDEMVHVRLAVERCWAQPQPLRAPWHSRVVDRLYVD